MAEALVVAAIVVAIVYGLRKFSQWFYVLGEQRAQREADREKTEQYPWGIG